MLRALLLPQSRGWASLSRLRLLAKPLLLALTPTLPPAITAPVSALVAAFRALVPPVGVSPTDYDLAAGRWLISTFRRRRTKMNKHKLKKRRKLLRLNTKVSRS